MSSKLLRKKNYYAKATSETPDWPKNLYEKPLFHPKAVMHSIKQDDEIGVGAAAVTTHGKFWGSAGAGCVFIARDTNRALVAYRSEYVNEPHTWGVWGGAIDDGEDPALAVKREVKEETGYTGPQELEKVHVYNNGEFRYTTFIAWVPTEFTPVLNWENDDYKWCAPGEWPSPLHFGLRGTAPLIDKARAGGKALDLPVDRMLTAATPPGTVTPLTSPPASLYHGTNISFAIEILKTESLSEGAHWGKKNEPHGPRLTKSEQVAWSFCKYAMLDAAEMPGGVVFEFDGPALGEAYKLVEYHDTSYEGDSFGEEEEVCAETKEIKPVARFIKAIHIDPIPDAELEEIGVWVDEVNGNPEGTFLEDYAKLLKHPKSRVATAKVASKAASAPARVPPGLDSPEIKEIIATHTISELVHYDWDKIAFGFSDGDILTLPLSALRIKYKMDMANVDGKDMAAYFKNTPFNELPLIEVSYEKGKFWIEDGYHRYGYARQLHLKKVDVIVEIKSNPFLVLGYDIDDIIEAKKRLEATSVRASLLKRAERRQINLEWVEKVRKDFLMLMKNVPLVKNYDDAETLGRNFTVFRNNFENVFFEQFLNRDLKYKSGLNATQIENIDSTVRAPGWAFSSELRLPLRDHDEHWSKEQCYTQFQEKVTTWETGLRKKAQAFWKAMKWVTELGLLPTEGLPVDVPDKEIVELEGFQCMVKGFQAKDRPKMDIIKAGLRLFRESAQERLPILLDFMLPLEIEFEAKVDAGGEYFGSYISLTASGVSDPRDVSHVVAHEMGHHIWNTLDDKAQNFWRTAIRGDYGDLDLKTLLDEWPEDAWAYQFPKLLADTDPVLGLQVGALRYDPNYKRLERKKDFQALLDSGETTLKVPKHPITDYANKSPNEAFCEAIGMLIGYGTRAVLPEVRNWLDIILPKSAKRARMRTARPEQQGTPAFQAWFHGSKVKTRTGPLVIYHGSDATLDNDWSQKRKGFYSTQIKSADQNSGAFNPENKRVTAATAGEIPSIVRKLMAVLPAGTPMPNIKVVNSPTSHWLGICRFKYGDDNTLIELQQSIIGDTHTLERVIAHELCHHAEFMESAAMAKEKGWSKETHAKIDKYTHRPHGPKFREWANKFNAIYGADFVTETSDSDMVRAESTRDINVLLWAKPNGKLYWCFTMRPSAKQREFIKDKLAQPGYKYVVTRDIDFAQGAPIGKSWSYSLDDGVNTKLQRLWDEAPEAKVASSKLLTKSAASDRKEVTDSRWIMGSKLLRCASKPTVNTAGAPISGTPEGIARFWSWFGDSKTVDAQGQPMVFYHGTTKGGFDEFSADALGSNTGSPSARLGFFFTPDLKAAEHYAAMTDPLGTAVYQAEKAIKETLKANGLTGKVYTGYSEGNIILAGNWRSHLPSNPTAEDVKKALMTAARERLDSNYETFAKFKADIEGKKKPAKWEQAALVKAQKSLDDAEKTLPLVEKALGKIKEFKAEWKEGQEIKDVYLKMLNPLVVDHEGHRDGRSFVDIIKDAKAGSHDGVIILNTEDPTPMDVYIVFAPQQIKGVDDARTTAGKTGAKKPVVDVNSEAFRRWFGNSKIVDEQGNPLPVFHGTPTGGFDVFETTGKRDTGWLGRGFYFTKDKALAKSFMSGRSSDGSGTPKKQVYAVFLKALNPIHIMSMDPDWVGKCIQAMRESTGRPPLSEEKLGAYLEEYAAAYKTGNQVAIARDLKHLGDPGYMARFMGHDAVLADFEGGSIMVFDPTQIKSATNNTNFDPDNPNIYASAKLLRRPVTAQVVFHGTQEAYDIPKPSKTAYKILWATEDQSVAANYANKRMAGDPVVWAITLKPSVNIVDLTDLSYPVIREIKEDISLGNRYTGGGEISDDRWPRYADFGILEGNPWVVKKLRANGVLAVRCKDTSSMSGGTYIQSIAILDDRAIASAVRVSGPEGPQGSKKSASTPDYPLAGPVVDGLTVGSQIPNQGSIPASLPDYEILDGIRVVPMSAFDADPKDLFYAADDMRRVIKLAEDIKASGYINPLIVIEDAQGLYVLEGSHRLGALFTLGKTEFPALVVRDTSEAPTHKGAKLLKKAISAPKTFWVALRPKNYQDFAKEVIEGRLPGVHGVSTSKEGIHDFIMDAEAVMEMPGAGFLQSNTDAKPVSYTVEDMLADNLKLFLRVADYDTVKQALHSFFYQLSPRSYTTDWFNDWYPTHPAPHLETMADVVAYLFKAAKAMHTFQPDTSKIEAAVEEDVKQVITNLQGEIEWTTGGSLSVPAGTKLYMRVWGPRPIPEVEKSADQPPPDKDAPYSQIQAYRTAENVVVVAREIASARPDIDVYLYKGEDPQADPVGIKAPTTV
jgi:8-oxo-dGTP pyrophosphatase MutT (NUDIX family)